MQLRIAALGLTMMACGPAHVRLPEPPAATAGIAERWDFYERVAPKAVDDQRVPGKSGRMVHDHWELALDDGTTVEAPEDLLPEVDASSATARAARRARRARRDSALLLGGALTAIATGVGLMFASDGGRSAARPLGFELGGAAVGAVLLLFGELRRNEIDPAVHHAFDGYDADLRARLRLCTDGLRVVACGDAASVAVSRRRGR